MEIRIELPGVRLGVVVADGLRVSPSDEVLTRLITEACERKRHELTLEHLADAEPMCTVRAMFRAWQIDPSKYRPSSEALLRRVVQGKGLYFVSNVVDIGNLGSIETMYPYGCHDRSRIRFPVVFRKGAPGEQYEGIGKRMWHLEKRPVLADHEGPFGSPISDSRRSMVTASARDILVVMYVPASIPEASIKEAMELICERLVLFAGANRTRSVICS
jgi:DNA/RNA-binding domain of Phe-tRNA-synthetase-like protein